MTASAFLASDQRQLPASALALARAFAAGGRLMVTAPGRQDHARHVAVEFVHPAITGARAFPAMAVGPGDLHHLVDGNDAVLCIDPAGDNDLVDLPQAAVMIRTDESGAQLVRWYHLLWELVQLSVEDQPVSANGDTTNFLYPFLDGGETDDEALVMRLARSAEGKVAESEALAAATAGRNDDVVSDAASAIVECSRAGGTVYAIGNGGSACDAARLVRLLANRGVRALSLADDPAVLTALANDLGAGMVFSRQVEAALRSDDVLVAFSTSGASSNLLAALDVAGAADATVVVSAGYDGGPLCQHGNVDHQLVVESSSVHRIQEAQAVLIDLLCAKVRP